MLDDSKNADSGHKLVFLVIRGSAVVEYVEPPLEVEFFEVLTIRVLRSVARNSGVTLDTVR